jgi:HPr kinase/phosphorylase
MEQFTVLELLDMDLKERNDLGLVCIAGREGLLRTIRTPDVNRPGLALNGFFDKFGSDRLQVFGRGEHAFIQKLSGEGDLSNIQRLFKREIPACVFTHGLAPPDEFLSLAEAAGVPVLQTELVTSEFVMRLIRALGSVFAERETIHATLVEVFGIGVLILGDSGVGKSETALELIERGHRLVADDAVEVRRVSGNSLLGQGANPALGHHMEIRGLGIINITHLFGVGSIRDDKQIQLMCQLEVWDSQKAYDRIGAEEHTREMLGVHIPYLEIPVKPGRNIPIIIETAAMNERLKKMGYYSAREFSHSVTRWLDSENARKAYLQKNAGK